MQGARGGGGGGGGAGGAGASAEALKRQQRSQRSARSAPSATSSGGGSKAASARGSTDASVFGSCAQGRLRGVSGVTPIGAAASASERRQAGDILVHEINALARVHHPNVIQLVGACVVNEDEPMLVLAFAGRGDLHHLLDTAGDDLTPATRLELMRGVCAGMATANTMHSVVEALGMCLPGHAPVRGNSPKMQANARAAGRRIVEMVWEALRPRQILTPAAFRNAVATLVLDLRDNPIQQKALALEPSVALLGGGAAVKPRVLLQ